MFYYENTKKNPIINCDIPLSYTSQPKAGSTMNEACTKASISIHLAMSLKQPELGQLAVTASQNV
jgi:hypothetical protein